MSKSKYDTAATTVEAAAERREDAIADLLDHYFSDGHGECDFVQALADATGDALEAWGPLHDERGAPEGVVLQ